MFHRLDTSLAIKLLACTHTYKHFRYSEGQPGGRALGVFAQIHKKHRHTGTVAIQLMGVHADTLCSVRDAAHGVCRSAGCAPVRQGES